jgi:hypothetical protein
MFDLLKGEAQIFERQNPVETRQLVVLVESVTGELIHGDRGSRPISS